MRRWRATSSTSTASQTEAGSFTDRPSAAPDDRDYWHASNGGWHSGSSHDTWMPWHQQSASVRRPWDERAGWHTRGHAGWCSDWDGSRAAAGRPARKDHVDPQHGADTEQAWAEASGPLHVAQGAQAACSEQSWAEYHEEAGAADAPRKGGVAARWTAVEEPRVSCVDDDDDPEGSEDMQKVLSILADYVHTLRGDSYAAPTMQTPLKDFISIEEEQDDDAIQHYRATASLPLLCPGGFVRVTSQWNRCKNAAQKEAADAVVKKLEEEELLPGDGGEAIEAIEETKHGKLPPAVSPILLKDIVDSEDCLVDEELRLVRINPTMEDGGSYMCKGQRFGFIVAAGDSMLYKLRLQTPSGCTLRLLPHDLSNNERFYIGLKEEDLLKYHRRVAMPLLAQAATSMAEAPSSRMPLLLVQLKTEDKGDPFDWDSMARSSANGNRMLPDWLGHVMLRYQLLGDLEATVRYYSPLQVVPEPSRLETALFGGTAEAPTGSAVPVGSFRALCEQGRAARGLLLATHLLLARPAEDAWRLRRRLEAQQSDALLEKFLPESGVPSIAAAFVTKWSGKPAAAVDALFGAIFEAGGGGFSVVAQLWKWLQGDAVRADAWGPAAGYLLFGQGPEHKVKGRTPSYSRLQQADGGGEPVLHVTYVDLGLFEYRRAIVGIRVHGERRVTDQGNNASWNPVSLDPHHLAYVAHRPDEDVLLPTKVAAWLSGQPLASMVKCKRHSGKTPSFVELCEAPDDGLRVTYDRTYDHANLITYTYRHAENGSLGWEVKQGMHPVPVAYSEWDKTLFSPTLDAPLPQRVVDWLLQPTCLAILVDGCRQHSSDKGTEGVEVTAGPSGVRFYIGERPAKCYLEPAPTGFMYMLQLEEPAEQIVPLTWSEVEKTWGFHDGSDGCWRSLPGPVLSWLRKHLREELSTPSHILETFLRHCLRRPWLRPPVHVRQLMPKGIDFATVQSELNYSFNNPLWLTEALTHASCSEAVTCSNDRLAFLGEKVVDALVVLSLCDLDTVGVPWLPDQKAPSGSGWPGDRGWGWSPHGENHESNYGPPWAEPYSWATQVPKDRAADLANRLEACCNHLAYACTASRLGLHKEGRLQASQRLIGDVRAFDRFHRATCAADQDPWLLLCSRGAPRALGDAFLAVAAAIFLDGGWRSTREVLSPALRDHISFCDRAVPALREQLEAAHRHFEEVTAESKFQGLSDRFLRFVREAKELKTVQSESLAPPPPPPTEAGASSTRGGQQDIDVQAQLESALRLTDVHLVHSIRGHELVGKCSPRAAQLSAAYSAGKGLLSPKNLRAKFEEAAEDLDDAAQQSTIVQGGAGFFFCDACQMSLNGPAQYEDHKAGRKHMKSIRRSTKAGKLLCRPGEEVPLQ